MATALAITVSTAGVASAQTPEPPPPPPPPPEDVRCYPLSVLCGFKMQIGPFGPFNFDILPGGSVFPPQPTP